MVICRRSGVVIVAVLAIVSAVVAPSVLATHANSVDGRTNKSSWHISASIPSSWTTALSNGALVWDNVSSQCHDFVRYQSGGSFFTWQGPIDGFKGVYAVTSSSHSSIEFDQAEMWHLNVNATPGSGSVDLWSVAAHEFGHILSLAHAEFYGGPSAATMWGTLNYGDISKRSLETYDQTHERGLYPVGSC